MSLFSKAENTSAYLKMGMLGQQGSGKTFTATEIAIGMVKLMRERSVAAANLPMFFIDTELGSDWVAPRIEAAGIELMTAKTRAFKDLPVMVAEAERGASILVIDSLTHFWTELKDAYMKAKRDRFGNPRTRLQFEDWAFLKAEWQKFTDIFVNSSLHVIVAGRAGFEYETTVDDDTGKKNLEKTGVKMKAESEMGYEPSLLVLMERHQEMDGNRVKTVYRTATVLKDRSTLLDGKEFSEPTFANFLPHIQRLNIGGRQLGVDTLRTSVSTIPADVRDNRATQRKIVLDEIESLLVLHHPSTGGADRKAKLELLRSHFNAAWTEIETVMPLERLRSGYDSLHAKLEGKPSRYAHLEDKPEINDELPGDMAPPKAATDLVQHDADRVVWEENAERPATLADHVDDGLELPPALDRREKPDALTGSMKASYIAEVRERIRKATNGAELAEWWRAPATVKARCDFDLTDDEMKPLDDFIQARLKNLKEGEPQVRISEIDELAPKEK